MHKILFCLFVLFSTVASAGNPPEQSPFKKVVIVVFENASPEEVLAQPMFKFLSERGAYFNNFHALARPSLPNYIAMTAASTWGITSNASISLEARNIVDLLEEKHFSWKVYAENYPGNNDLCYLADKSPDGLYVRKHNPFINFLNINSSKRRCAHIVNAQDEFQQDVDSHNLPDYSFYIPNLINNGHNNGAIDADAWLRQFYFNVMTDDYVERSDVLFILTFDESDPAEQVPDPLAYFFNQVYTLFYGTMVEAVELDQYYDFYNLITTIEDAWGLKSLKLNDQNSTPVSDKVWKCDYYQPWCFNKETY